MGAPAGSEYLPAAPSATGGQNGEGGDGSESSAGSTGAGGCRCRRRGDQPKGGDRGEGEQAAGSSDTISVAPASASDEDSSSGAFDTLLDPIVLLLIAGVAAVTVGMTLRRRAGGEHEGPRAPRDPGRAPRTPEGEIASGTEQQP